MNSSLITIRYVYLISTSFPQGPARVRWAKRIGTIFALCNCGEMGNKVLLDYLPCLSCYFYRSIKIFLNVLFTCLNRIVRHVEIFLQSARWIMGELKSRYLGFGGKRSFHPWNLLFRYQNFQWQWVILMKLPAVYHCSRRCWGNPNTAQNTLSLCREGSGQDWISNAIEGKSSGKFISYAHDWFCGIVCFFKLIGVDYVVAVNLQSWQSY